MIIIIMIVLGIMYLIHDKLNLEFNLVLDCEGGRAYMYGSS